MKKLVLMLLMATTLSGCASVIKGKTQNINVTTPNGKDVEATVFTSAGMQEMQLPRVIAVPKDSQDITINVKEGKCHKETVSTVPSHIEPWFFGNILSGGILGSTTDSITGAMWRYDEQVTVTIDEKISCNE